MDWRLALRALRRAPGFTATASIILAIGIGASLAVLALADRLLFRPLPFPDADRVVLLLETTKAGQFRLPSFPTVRDWRAQGTVFGAIAYVPGTGVPWRGPEGVETITTAFPSAEFFPLMGTPALLGRTLTAADEVTGDRVAVLSHALWRRRFAGDPRVLGTTISLGEGPTTIVGVLPAGFRYPEWADMYLPLRLLPAPQQAAIALRGNHVDSRVIGRLEPGVSVDRAQAAMAVVADRLAREYPVEQGDWTSVALVPIREVLYNPRNFGASGLASPVKTVLLFAGAVGLVFLIGCANVAGLTLVRGVGRERELAIRSAIGAGRGDLIRQLLTESAVLAGLGGILGIALATGLLRLLKHSAPTLLPRLAEVELDPRLAMVTVGLAALAALGSGLVPALRATPRSLAQLVKDGGSQGTSSRSRTAMQRGLVTLQLGLAMTLLVGAAVLVHSFVRAIDTAVGFDPEGLIAVTANPPDRSGRTPERAVAQYRDLQAALARLPGVQSVAITNHIPLTGASYPTRLVIEGYTPPSASGEPSANFRLVSPEYFATMRIPVTRGRVFTESDLAAPNDGLVVNESLARRYWPGQDPVGRRLTVFKSARWLPDFGEPLSGLVIGVVGDVRHFGSETTPPDEVYLPYTWNPWAWTGLVVRAKGDPARLIDPVRRAITAIDPDFPLTTGATRNVTTFAEMLVDGRTPRRLMTGVAVGLATAALLLAVVGLYGVMAYVVGLRRREIAIRGALGATRSAILGLVMRQGLALGLVGTALGLAGGWFAAALLEGLVFGVSVRDWVAFTTVPLLLIGVTVLAVYLPARRASDLDPAAVLKDG